MSGCAIVNDLALMIELQRIWDIVVSSKEGIARCDKSIAHWRGRVDELRLRLESVGSRLDSLKGSSRSKELILKELGEKLAKLEKTRDIIKNEKEMKALAAQIETVRSEYDIVETDVINELESIDQHKAEIDKMLAELAVLEESVARDIQKLEEAKSDHEDVMKRANIEFDLHSDKLSAAVRAKFIKMLGSSGSRAIAPLSGDICTACNFQQPASIQSDISRGGAVPVCVNCGRFLHKKY